MAEAQAVADDAVTRARTAIAAAVTRSWTTIPHFSVGRDIPADGLRPALAAARAEIPGATITDLLLRALARAARENGTTPTDQLGLSVASGRGVVNISIADPGDCTLAELSERRSAAVRRARAGTLRSSDFKPFALVLSNLGTHGAHWFTGIIPVGSTLLVTTGAVRPSTGQDGEPATVFSAVGNADHRAHDGADVARLLVSFETHCREAA